MHNIFKQICIEISVIILYVIKVLLSLLLQYRLLLIKKPIRKERLIQLYIYKLYWIISSINTNNTCSCSWYDSLLPQSNSNKIAWSCLATVEILASTSYIDDTNARRAIVQLRHVELCTLSEKLGARESAVQTAVTLRLLQLAGSFTSLLCGLMKEKRSHVFLPLRMKSRTIVVVSESSIARIRTSLMAFDVIQKLRNNSFFL